MSSPPQIEILLVEDDEADALLTKRLIQKAGHLATINVVTDGVEALDYLRHEAPFEKSTRPDIVLLDLNLPRKDGREVLAEIKSDDALKSIPVVVLSTSDSDTDVSELYGLQACGYLAKPANLSRFGHSLECLLNYWLGAVELPERPLSGTLDSLRLNC